MNTRITTLGKPKQFIGDVFGVIGRFLAQIFLSWVIFLPFNVLFFVSPDKWGNNESYVAMWEIAKLIVITISVFLVSKFIDEREPEDFGLKKDWTAIKDFTAGIFFTFCALGFNFFIFLGLDFIRITGYAWQSKSSSSVILYTLGTFIIFGFTGWSEELLSRGFHLQTIKSKFNKFWAIFISSLIFSYLHRYNQDMTISGLIFIFFSGLVLAYAYIQTNSLWLSIGLHTGWDFFVVNIFFGIPLGNLRLFSLIETTSSITDNVQINFIYFMQYFALFICVLCIRKYTKNQNNTNTS